MSQYPHELQPSTFEVIELSNGRCVEIAKATPRFQRWVGTAAINNYGGKAVLDFAGQPSFAGRNNSVRNLFAHGSASVGYDPAQWGPPLATAHGVGGGVSVQRGTSGLPEL